MRAQLLERDKQITLLSERIRELERMLGGNSRNSGRPPSSDGLAKPRAKDGRKRGSRRPGGQPGHQGSTLKRSATPDHVVDHFPERCQGCGLAFDGQGMEFHSARQVHDLPEPRPLEVSEHRAHRCRCRGCGQRTVAAYPDGVCAPVQYGPRIGSLILYLSVAQLLPMKRLRETLLHLHGVSLSQGTVHSVMRRAAAAYAGFWHHLRSTLAAAPVAHFDETGMRVAGRLRWFHVACTGLVCQFRLGESRGDIMAEATGVAVHDHWKPYWRMTAAEHGLCNAHILRELQALVDNDDEVWAGQHDLPPVGGDQCGEGADGHRAVGSLNSRTTTTSLSATASEHHEALPALRSKRKGRPKRRPGHNLAIRLRDHKAETLRFLRNPAVPPTNNMVEQDLRFLKVKQKISGSFRTEAGAMAFAVVRSLVETARKQGWDIIQVLRMDPELLIAMLRTEGPLPET